MTASLVEEFVHSCNVKGIIDLTMGPGTWAKVAVERSIPYFGVALSSAHMIAMYNHIEEYTRSCTRNEASALYLGVKNPAANPVPQDPTPKPKPKRGVGKPKPNPTPGSPASSGSESDGGGGD